MKIRAAEPSDVGQWLALRCALWPSGTESEHREEIARFFSGRSKEPLGVLLAFDGEDLIGFAELSLRPYAEGCKSSPVAFLEGWYVAPHARRSGVGRALVAAAEDWGRTQGCTEFASDAKPENTDSHAAHQALGFEDVGLIRCFRKSL